MFLFNDENKLLLQQRSEEKITFPNVWTNTCCSHPLFFKEELELENQLGVKRAAVRKLEHELGIPPHEVSVDRFKYLTRLHYKAPCDTPSGTDPEWGEHEIDHLLFIKARVSINMNPREVRDYKYVDAAELRTMMSDTKLKWSPWFRKIESKLLPLWWENLDKTLETDDFVDGQIHRL